MDEDDGVGGIPEWVVTFGDMMSLLLTFFIMLVSLSEVKQEEKFQAMVESMRKQFGYDRSQLSVMPGKSRPRNSEIAKLSTTGRARRLDVMQGGHKSKSPIGSDAPPHNIETGELTEGLTISFKEGEIELSEDNKAKLLAQAEGLRGKPQKIEIRGHTSRKPIGRKAPKFDSNWDLGYARCQNVMRFLIDEGGIAEHRLLLSQAGGFQPLPKSDSPGESINARIPGKSSNARVEVTMLDQYSVDALSSPKVRDRFEDAQSTQDAKKSQKKQP